MQVDMYYLKEGDKFLEEGYPEIWEVLSCENSTDHEGNRCSTIKSKMIAGNHPGLLFTWYETPHYRHSLVLLDDDGNPFTPTIG